MSDTIAEERVKASALIAELRKGGYEARVVNAGDLHPFLSAVTVEVDEESRICTLAGTYSYHEECAEHGIDIGQSMATVLGVDFYRGILDMNDQEIEIDGLIDYDNGLSEADVIQAADEGISFVDYDTEAFPFREEEVTDEEIAERLDWSVGDEAFARGPDGTIYSYENQEDIPDGFSPLTRKEAIEALSKARPGITYTD